MFFGLSQVLGRYHLRLESVLAIAVHADSTSRGDDAIDVIGVSDAVALDGLSTHRVPQQEDFLTWRVFLRDSDQLVDVTDN